MKSRQTLSQAELAALHADLDRRLDAVGFDTHPGVALRILDLTQNPDAGMQDYARVIRSDPGLVGRLIRLSNSAAYAQRDPVTSIDRACVMLGAARLRAVSLGFYLAQAAASEPRSIISREIWGQSVYRACLASELARAVLPELAPEAFVVGLMLDAGVPVAAKLLGDDYVELYAQGLSPARSFAAEYETVPFTHVDVMTALVRRWHFPDVLAKPILWHHTPPPAPSGLESPLQILYRIAYVAGSVALRPSGAPQSDDPVDCDLRAPLGLSKAELRNVLSATTREFRSVIDLFADVADRPNLAEMVERAHHQLVGTFDDVLTNSLEQEDALKPQQFRLGGLLVRVRPEERGLASAFSYDSAGEPLSLYRFPIRGATPDKIRTALGLDPEPGDDIDALRAFLLRIAA